MDERHQLMLGLLFVFLTVIFFFNKMHIAVVEIEEDLVEERRFSESILREYSALIGVNNKLRNRVIDLHLNLSFVENEVRACIGKLPENISRSTPQRRVPLSHLEFSADAVVINVKDITPGIIAPTGSMSPLLAKDNIVLELTPEEAGEILPGDIIIYEHEGGRVIHRVVKIGWDTHGWFAITKGDNNPAEDPYKVRFPQVRGILVGIIY